MAYPTFDTDGSATDKFLQLIDFSEDSWAMTAIETAVVTGDNYGWMGIATHVEGNAITAPGGFTTSAAPIVLVGGDKGGNVAALDIGGGAEAEALLVTIATDSGGTVAVTHAALTELGLAINSNKLDVDIASSSVDVMLGSDFSVVFGTASLLTTTQADNLANTLDGLQTTTFNYVYDGTTWDRMLGDSTDGVLVNLGSNNDVVATNAGTFVVQVDGTALTALQLIDDTVAVLGTATYSEATTKGNVMGAVRNDSLATLASLDNEIAPLQVDGNGALYVTIQDGGNAITVDAASSAFGAAVEGDVDHGSTDANAPVKIGGRAQGVGQPEEVADNQRVDALFDRNGYLHVRGELEPLHAALDAVTTNGNNTIVAAVANKRIAVWGIALISDGTVDTRWEDGAGGTAFTGQMALQAREGYTMSAGGIVPIFVGTANTLLNLELNATTPVNGVVTYTLMDD